MDFEKQNLPVIDIEQLESLFADFILWYDKGYCKTKEGAYEVVGEYITREKSDQEEIMTKDELKEQLKDLENKYNRNVRDLKIKHAISNNKVKVGDIITDHYHTIKVINTPLRFSGIGMVNGGAFDIIYMGIELKKDSTPKKCQQNTIMFQSNIELINGEKYKDGN